MHCYVVLIVMYSNCSEWNISKEQTVINLSAMLLLKVTGLEPFVLPFPMDKLIIIIIKVYLC